MNLTELRLAGVAVALAAIGLGVHLLLASERAQGAAQCRAEQAQATVAFNAKSSAQAASWAATTQQAVEDGNAKLLDVARASSRVGAALDGAVARLRERASCPAGVPSDPATAASSPAAAAPGDLSADVLRGLGGFAAEVSKYADTLRVSNGICVASHPK